MSILSQEPAFHYDPRSSQRDKYLFGLLFIVGTVLIVLSKWLLSSRWIPVGVASVALLTYALLTTGVDRFRLREDRAGDNAYYLGFLFTLTSLAYALFAFENEEQQVPQVIGNFALALVSTILGLAIRVWFQQLREDPVEFEHEARLAMGQAAVQLRAALVGAVEDFSVLRQRVQTELQQDFAEQVKTLIAASASEMKTMSDSHVNWLSTTSEQFRQDRDQILAQTTDQKNALSRLTKTFEALIARLEVVELPTEVIKRRFSDLVAGMDNLLENEQDRIKKQVEALAPIVSILGSVNSVSAAMDTRMKELATSARGVTDAATTSTAAIQLLSTALQNCGTLVTKSVQVNTGEVERMASIAMTLSDETEKAVRALSSDVLRSAEDVVTLRRELVRAADLVTRELGGGGN